METLSCPWRGLEKLNWKENINEKADFKVAQELMSNATKQEQTEEKKSCHVQQDAEK